LATLDLSDCLIEGISCNNNLLTEIDVSGQPELEYLNSDDNQLKVLDLSKNPKLYNLLISSTKGLSKEFGKFSKIITHDTTTIMQLNSGLYELMKEYDESKKYNKGESEEAQEDIANNKFQKKKTSEDLKRYYPDIDENREPGE
jgi:hypothetical protein